jgi:electron transfer flavoprotein-quinone oxidoreductase
MRHYRKLPGLMENPRLFTQYPQMVANIMSELFTVDGAKPTPLWKTILKQGKRVGLMNLLKDGIAGGRAL